MASTPVPSDKMRRASHGHRLSTNISAADTLQSPKHTISPTYQALPSKRASQHETKLHYTVFVRLPFPRASFEDPPFVEWDALKDRQLWELISGASNSRELDWEQMAEDFGVSLQFLLMQAAWLYERHYEGMKKQMLRVGVSGGVSGTASPARSGVDIEGGNVRPGYKDHQRAPSSLSINSAQAAQADQTSAPPTPKTTTIPRTQSSSTVTQSRHATVTGSGRPPTTSAFKTASAAQRRPALSTRSDQPTLTVDRSNTHRDHISESDSGEEPTLSITRTQHYSRRIQMLGRRPMMTSALQTSTLGSDGDAEDGEDDSSGTLPFAAVSKTAKEDPAATIRESPRKQVATLHQPALTAAKQAPQALPPPESSASSFSSASAGPIQSAPIPSESESGTSGSNIKEPTSAGVNPRQENRPGPLSPRHRAELAKLSPRYKREGSDGSPSMGSSYSDLDDTSVTRSALEDALLSNIRQGGSIVSRMGSMRDVLKRS